MDWPMRTLWPDRQCCQGAEISAAKHLDFLSKISTGITGLLNFPLPFWLIRQTTYDLATLARALFLPGKARLNGNNMLNFKYEDVFK
jgi:hypothetical protein